MTDEAIIESLESDPKGFLANFAQQVVTEAENRFNATTKQNQAKANQTQQEKAIDDLYADYESKNPDFVVMWDEGKIQKFMDENPGHTPISAHQVITATKTAEDLKNSQETLIKEAVDKAVGEATKNFKAKRSSRTIAAGPGGGSQAANEGTPADLADTKEHGGLMSVLTRRSLAREKAAQ
jgi:hypothetical protein